MFMAELKNKILTSGHDLDDIKGEPFFDLATEGDEYVKLNGDRQTLPKNDVILSDDEGVLASILFGPAARTSITLKTSNPVYFAWCPINMDYTQVDEHLSTIQRYLGIIYGETKSSRKIM